ncbi:MAG: hypothetical protein JRG83_11585 [Deltaproteobacteria bacterium]|nr:hypothetical protein [Deltaproteobacteria bacterium]
MTWSFGDCLDGCERVLPADALVLVHADRREAWNGRRLASAPPETQPAHLAAQNPAAGLAITPMVGP